MQYVDCLNHICNIVDPLMSAICIQNHRIDPNSAFTPFRSWVSWRSSSRWSWTRRSCRRRRTTSSSPSSPSTSSCTSSSPSSCAPPTCAKTRCVRMNSLGLQTQFCHHYPLRIGQRVHLISTSSTSAVRSSLHLSLQTCLNLPFFYLSPPKYMLKNNYHLSLKGIRRLQLVPHAESQRPRQGHVPRLRGAQKVTYQE